MRRSRKWLSNCGYAVSIHAPWEGCDHVGRYSKLSDDSFNSRTLGRVRHHLLIEVSLGYWFQFTHPGKGATAASHLSPIWAIMFQFTHPGKGATQTTLGWRCLFLVSIHAPWEGCDNSYGYYPALTSCFNSRTLGRVRRSADRQNQTTKTFQFTHPGKGATTASFPASIPARSFNSRTLGRVRLCSRLKQVSTKYKFQFTHPGKGATRASPPPRPRPRSFNSRTLGRVRRLIFRIARGIAKFQFTHPGKGATF